MWGLHEDGAICLFAIIVFLLVFSLVFSFRDTIRALAEFFDIRAIRRLLRKPLAIVFVHAFVVVLLLGWCCFEDLCAFGLALTLIGLFLVPGLSLAWILVTDVFEAFGRGTRGGRRRRRSGRGDAQQIGR